jgi:hypothetical protein
MLGLRRGGFVSGNKRKFSRARLKKQQRGRLLDAAKKNHPSYIPSTFVRDASGYHDGKLVHTVFHGKRTFPVVDTTRWGEYLVWATGCNQVIAVESARFSWTKRPVTCLTCAVDHYGR